MHGIGVTLVIAKKTSINQQVERSLVPMAIDPAGLDLVNPKVLHPRLALPRLIGCQTSLKSLISGANFRKSVRGTDSRGTDSPSLLRFIRHPAVPQTPGGPQHVEQ